MILTLIFGSHPRLSFVAWVGLLTVGFKLKNELKSLE